MTDEKKGPEGLADLKAKLGLGGLISGSKPKPAASSPKQSSGGFPASSSGGFPASQPPASGFTMPQSGGGGFVNPSASPFTKPAPPPDRPPEDDEPKPEPEPDYGSAVSTTEDPEEWEGKDDVVKMVAEDSKWNDIDENLRTPVSGGTKMLLLGVIAVVILGALYGGFAFGKVMRDRAVANNIIDNAQSLVERLNTTVDTLAAFQSELQAFCLNENVASCNFNYSEPLHEIISDYFPPEGAPVIAAGVLADARTIFTTGDELVESLLNFSIGTQLLDSRVRNHFSRTAVDSRLINDLMAETDENEYFGVIFDNDVMFGLYQAYNNQTAEAPVDWISPPGQVVRFIPQWFNYGYNSIEDCAAAEADPLRCLHQPDIVRQTDLESADQRDRFPVEKLPDLDPDEIPLYWFVTIDNRYFDRSAGQETAITRYSARVRAIREMTNQLVGSSRRLIEMIENRAIQSKSFTL